MPVAEHKFTVTEALASDQVGEFQSGVVVLLEAAGYEEVARSTADAVGQVERTYRWPGTDIHSSDVDLLNIWHSSTTTRLFYVLDADANTNYNTTHATWTVSGGERTAAPFPTAGAPDNKLSISLTNYATGGFWTNGDTYTVRGIASEHGFVGELAEDVGTTGWVFGLFRPLARLMTGREFCLEGTLTGTTVTFTTATPWDFEVFGETVTPTFPTGTALTPFQICREISKARPGLFEAVPARDRTGTWKIKFQTPPAAAPSAAFSITGNSFRVRCTRQDTSVAGIDLRLSSNQSFSSVTTGTRGILSKDFGDFLRRKVRVGCTVLNRDLGTTAEIVGFGSLAGGGVDEGKIICDQVPAPWTSDHTYDILPTTDWGLGVGCRGGYGQIVLASDEAADIDDQASVEVLVNDIFGEMRDKFTVGQKLPIYNNSMALKIDLATQIFEVGEKITNVTTGAKGIVRGISGTTAIVDYTEGPTTFGAAPWASGNTVSQNTDANNRREGGSTQTTISTVTASSNLGDATWAEVLAVATNDVPNGDWRTKLTLKTDQNAAFQVSPGARVGFNMTGILDASAVSGILDFSTNGGSWGPTFETGGTATFNTNGVDVRGSETLSPAAIALYSPDNVTGSLDLSEMMMRTNVPTGGQYGSSQLLGRMLHFRNVDIGGAAEGDVIYEDGDTERAWSARAFQNSAAATAAADTTDNGRVCIGPGTAGWAA